MKTVKILLVVIIVLLSISGSHSQTLKISAYNLTISAQDSIVFEFWINNQTTSTISYLYGQYFANIKKSALGGAETATLRILASGLPSAFVPRNPTVFFMSGVDTCQLRLAANNSPGIGNGYALTPGANVMVCRLSLRLPSGYVFNTANWNFWWRTRFYPAPQTKIFHDPGGSASEYTNVSYFTSMLTGIETNPEIPKEFSLYQNYPNPFNSATKIKYSLPSNEFVRITIFDITGKEITTLVNQDKTAGIYEITFDASPYPSGVYYYKLSAGNFYETRKMILVK